MSILEQIKLKAANSKYLEYKNILGEVGKWGFTWNAPATQSEIEKLEKEKGIFLPYEYKKFLLLSNGATLFETSGEESGYKFLGITEIILSTEEMKQWGYDLKEEWFVFMKVLYSYDVLIFDLSQKDTNKYIIDGDVGYPSREWTYLSGGIDKLFARMYQCNGSMYWRW